LRTYQKALIEVKENQRKKLAEKRRSRTKPKHGALSREDLLFSDNFFLWFSLTSIKAF
jgi:hypothetical protein